MGVGFFSLSTRWLTIMLVATGLGWGGIVWVSSPSPLWLHFGFALLTAGVLAVLRQSKEAAEAGNRTKSEFLAMMSHELRTPLHIILGYTELLAEGAGGALPAEALAMLAKVHLKAAELVELITVVLDVSQMETGQLVSEVSAVGVAELLAELRAETQNLQEQSGLDFVW